MKTMTATEKSYTAIEGWKVTYFEPTFGMREFTCTGHRAVADMAMHKEWLDAGGYIYTVREIPKYTGPGRRS